MFKVVTKFVIERELSSGSFGKIFAGKWINERGEEIPAAAKTLINGADEDLNKEFGSLLQLDHLFVIKCYGICELGFSKLATRFTIYFLNYVYIWKLRSK